MIVVADSSPLILLARIGELSLLQGLFGEVTVTEEVLAEVAVGLGKRMGTEQILEAIWLRPVRIEDFHPAEGEFGLGIGELSAIRLAKQWNADLILLDDMRARRRAMIEGLTPIGCVGLLKAAFVKGMLNDLRKGYSDLAAAGAWLGAC